MKTKTEWWSKKDLKNIIPICGNILYKTLQKHCF